MLTSRLLHMALGLMLTACTEATTQPGAPRPVGKGTSDILALDERVKFWKNNAAVYWQGAARAVVARNNSNALQALRAYPIVAVAQYNAAVAAEKGKDEDVHPSVRAAISAASVVALTYLYPADGPTLEALLDAYLNDGSVLAIERRDLDVGEAIGRTVAMEIVERARTDRFFDPWTGTVPSGPGIWYSTTAPTGPQIGQAKTYFLTSGDQFRPPPHPVFGSAEFAAAVAEVRTISDNRTPEQDANAKFWNLPPGTYTPAGFWNEEAARLAVQYRLGERKTAHLMALMHMVGYDALVASHEAKYHYWLLRPTQADPGITLSFGLPNFPSYPSNHAAISAGMARVIGAVLPAEKVRLDALADEAALSRVLGGIHYRFDGNAGLELGRKVAAFALANDVVGHEQFTLKP